MKQAITATFVLASLLAMSISGASLKQRLAEVKNVQLSELEAQVQGYNNTSDCGCGGVWCSCAGLPCSPCQLSVL